MNETSKAMRRRMCEEESGGFEWSSVFAGKGVDVGPGGDPLWFNDCILFDKELGDANRLSDHIHHNSLDYLHASQSLEHMADPGQALGDWLKVLKPGGWVVVTVPDLTLYEGMQFPSRFNPDHKSTWSLYFKKSPCDQHVYVPDFIHSFNGLADRLLMRLVDNNYNYKIGTSKDQTLPECDGVEAFIEFVLKKR